VIAVRIVPPGHEQPAGADRFGMARDGVHGSIELGAAGRRRGVAQIEEAEPLLGQAEAGEGAAGLVAPQRGQPRSRIAG